MSYGLIVVQNRPQLIYLYAYCQEFGSGKSFDIVCVGPVQIPNSLIRLCSQANINLVNLETAQKKQYKKLIVSSFGHFAAHKVLINSISYVELSYFSDTLGNTLFDASYGSLKVSEIIGFGSYYKSTNFLRICQSAHDASISVVSLMEIKKAWIEIANLHLPDSKGLDFQNDDNLIVLRYWGNELMYPFKSGRSLREFLSSQQIFGNSTQRSIIRRDPRDLTLNFEELFQQLSRENNFLVDYDSVFEEITDFPELSSPEALLFRSSVGPKNIFALDSMLNLAAWFNFPECKISWIESSQINDLFQSDLESEFIMENITNYKQVIQILERTNSSPTISVDDSARYAVMNKLLFNHFEQISF